LEGSNSDGDQTPGLFDPKPFFARIGTAAASANTTRAKSFFSTRRPWATRVFYIQKGKASSRVSEQGKEPFRNIGYVRFSSARDVFAGQAQRMATGHDQARPGHRRIGKSRFPSAPSGTCVSEIVHCASSGQEHPRRNGPDRSHCSIRARSGLPAAPAAGELRQGVIPEPVIAKISQETLGG